MEVTDGRASLRRTFQNAGRRVGAAVLDEAGEPTGPGLGLLRWVDAGSGVTLESVGIGNDGPVGGLEGMRRLDGSVLANGAGPDPFVLTVTHGGSGGNGADTISLAAGDAVDGQGGLGLAYPAGTWTLPVLLEATPTP